MVNSFSAIPRLTTENQTFCMSRFIAGFLFFVMICILHITLIQFDNFLEIRFITKHLRIFECS